MPERSKASEKTVFIAGPHCFAGPSYLRQMSANANSHDLTTGLSSCYRGMVRLDCRRMFFLVP